MSVAQRMSAAAVQTADRLDLRAVLVLVACCACWGLNQAAIKIANTGISPILQVGLRSIPAALLVFAWARFRGVRLFDRDGTLSAGVLVGLLFAAEFATLYIGLQHTTASRGILFLYLAPFIVAFGAHFLIPGDRLTLLKTCGLAAAFLGLAVAMGDGFTTPGRPTLLGDVLCLLAALLWGATTVLIRVTPLRTASPEKTLLYQLAVSAVVLPPISMLAGEPGITDLGTAVQLSFAYTVVIVAFISYIAWFWLVRTYPPTRVSAFTFLSPVFGVAGGNLILREPLTLSLVAALALIAFGIYLVNKPEGART